MKTVRIFLILVSLLILTSTLALTSTFAAIPHIMNYQGKATDKDGAPLNSDATHIYNLTFRIYNAATGGTTKWTETQSGVPITNGVFSVQLGSVTPLNLAFDEDYWISLQVNTDSEMTPRTKLVSVPYAYRADKANSLTEDPVVQFYKKGFDIEYADLNSVKITPGVMDVAGKMFTTAAHSKSLQLSYPDNPVSRDWVHGQKMNNSVVCVYAYNNNGQIDFKLSDEAADLSNNSGDRTKKPFLYQKYPDAADGLYYRYIGNFTINSQGMVSAIRNLDTGEPVSIFSLFGGDSSNGDLTISSDTNFSAIDDPARPGVAQFHNLTIEAGKKLTIDTHFGYMGVSGTLILNGAISADGQGGAGGAAANCGHAGNGQNGELISFARKGASLSAADYYTIQPIPFSVAGAGGGGGVASISGGCGGGSGGFGGRGNGVSVNTYPLDSDALPTRAEKILRLTRGTGNNESASHGVGDILHIISYCGGGGGGSSGEGAGYGHDGAPGGGVIYIECDTLVAGADGALTADGLNCIGSDPDPWSGGGGGGVILIRAKTINSTPTAGNITVSGGVNEGVTRPGGAGAAGFKDIILVQ